MAHIPKPRANLKTRTDEGILRRNTKRYSRPRYLKYSFIEEELQDVQMLLQNPQYGDMAYIAYQHKFPSSTVRTWKAKIKADPSYDITKGYKDQRRRIFTSEEEKINCRLYQDKHYWNRKTLYLSMSKYLVRWKSKQGPYLDGVTKALGRPVLPQGMLYRT